MTTPMKVPTASNASLAPTNREIAEAMRVARINQDAVPERITQALAQKKTLHLVAAKMSEMNWGKGMDEMTRRAVAAYLERHQLDLTEVDVLGGTLYRNSRYYKRRLAEMVEDGLVVYAKSDWVQNDLRLDAMAADNNAWAIGEKQRRAQLRIEYGIPEAAVGACIFRIMLHTVQQEFTAAKWCGGGTRKSDPVGDQFPMETSETRACRRAVTLCASSIPALRWREEEMDEQGTDLTVAIRESRGALEVEPPRHAAPIQQLPEGDPYSTKMSREESLQLDAEIAQAE